MDQQANLKEWKMLQELKLETLLLNNFNKAKRLMLEKFDIVFIPEYKTKSNDIENFIKILLQTPIEPRVKYIQTGWFQFKKSTFPVKIRDFFNKKEGVVVGDMLTDITFIDPVPFTNSLQNVTTKHLMSGGQSVVSFFDVKKEFQLINKNSLHFLLNYELTLANAVTQEISTKAIFQILEGIRNLESAEDIRKRILGVWNESFNVVVPPKLDKNDEVLRAGHSYKLFLPELALTISKTEPSRAFVMGELVGYEQVGIIEVMTAIDPLEKECSSCNTLKDQFFKINDAHGIFPLHPGCHCHFFPNIKNYLQTCKQAKENLTKLYAFEV